MKAAPAVLALAACLLGAAPRGCLALSPLLHRGGASGSGEVHRPSSSLRHAPPLRMVGGGSLSPEPERPAPAQPQQRWAEYAVPDLEVPTKTQREPRPMAQTPPRPKIVVFGASGRIGRRIVKKLLGSGADLDVVAFVRDAAKLGRVLYDEEDLVMENLLNGGDGGGGGERRGPRLHVVEGDVVSRRDVYRRSFETDDEAAALDGWVGRARRYFASQGWRHDNSTEIHSFEDDAKVAADVDVLESGGEEVLRDAIAGSTVLVSCLGTHRPSNVWTDYLRVPVLRVFRRNAARWCSDPRHPYYVNYLSTKKILEEAEKEQRRRDAAAEFERERMALEEQLRRGRPTRRDEEGFESEVAARLASLRKKRAGMPRSIGPDGVALPNGGMRASATDRIKFIRVSHNMVGRSPFRPFSVLSNVLYSQLSRFETMSELLMESCKVVDTIVLRPGDLTDEERNANHTSLQLSIDGKVEYPSMIGREDVADLAVVSALTKTVLNETDAESAGAVNTLQNPPAHHYTWAMRWTGQHLSPPQGLRPDGLGTVALCFVKALREQAKLDKERVSNEQRIASYHGGKELIRLKNWRRRLRPYAQSLAVSIPLYTSMAVVAWYLFGNAFIELLTRLKRLPGALLNVLP